MFCSVLLQPAADLCQFNRAQVVYHALYNHLYSREAPLIQVGRQNFIVTCLAVLRIGPTRDSQPKARGGRACSLADSPVRLLLADACGQETK